MHMGSVALIGAGPGDPELLTVRATKRLAGADVVFYDALVDLRALDLAPRAKRVFVGKRAGRHAMPQDAINRLMIRAARRGLAVVRLKGGDPFVFGRGGEEALALVAAGVPFEIVPGISSAIAAPALAGVPVTHRGISTGFLVVSGHAEEAYRPLLESVAPASATIVVLMGLGRIDSIAKLLVERGWMPSTPVAVVVGASTESGSTWTSSLADICAGLPFEDTGPPGTIVIGDVVRLRAILASREAQLKLRPTAEGRNGWNTHTPVGRNVSGATHDEENDHGVHRSRRDARPRAALVR